MSDEEDGEVAMSPSSRSSSKVPPSKTTNDIVTQTKAEKMTSLIDDVLRKNNLNTVNDDDVLLGDPNTPNELL